MGPAAEPPGPHAAPLRRLGLSARDVPGLERYLDLLATWSARVNLTGARSPEERVALLVAPVLPAVPLPGPGRLLDVGSGNGSPGLVLALLRPDLAVTLLEPRRRRWAFLREAARVVGRPDISVVPARHDRYTGPPAETVTLRGLALPLAELTPLVAPGGRVLVFGAAPGPAAPLVPSASPAPGRLHVFRRR